MAAKNPDRSVFAYLPVSVIVIFIGLAVTALIMAPVMALTRGNIGINRVNRSWPRAFCIDTTSIFPGIEDCREH
jgi:hypothetical protein